MRQDDQREVTVALNADTSKYTKGLKEANAETTKLSKAVSVLSEKTDGLVKNSSKKLILFGTGQLAALSGMSTIAATLEKQMADINTQASIVGKSMDADKIKDNIKSLSTQIPLARHEIVAMSNAITNMGVTSTRQINDLTKSFLQLGAATGEPAAAVGAGMIQLQRQMGTFSQNTQVTSNMNDSLTALSLQGGTPAADILGFSGQIAPSARVAGMSQQSVMGISTAFTRAGEDGRYAVSMLNSLNNDLTMMKATNSPELTRYAHTLGVSVNDLKEMSPEQIFSQLLSTVQTQGGAQGLQTLSLLGLGDNPRAVKAIQAVANAGGIDKWIGVSNEKYGSGETEKAAGESWSGFFDSLTVLRNQFTQLGQQLGETILPILTKMASAASSFLEAIKPLTDMIMTVVGTLSGGIGTALIGAGVAGRLWAAASTPSIIKRGISGTSVQAFRYGKMRGSREAGGFEPFANRNAEQIHSQMNPSHPHAFGSANRWIYGMGERFGRTMPYDPTKQSNIPRYIFKTPLGILGRSTRWFIDATTQHYGVSTLAGGNERIGGRYIDPVTGEEKREQIRMRPRGFFSSMGSAFAHGTRDVTGFDSSTPKNDAKLKKPLTPQQMLSNEIKSLTKTIVAPVKNVMDAYTQVIKDARSAQEKAHAQMQKALQNLVNSINEYAIKLAGMVNPNFQKGVALAIRDPEEAKRLAAEEARKADAAAEKAKGEATAKRADQIKDANRKLQQNPVYQRTVSLTEQLKDKAGVFAPPKVDQPYTQPVPAVKPPGMSWSQWLAGRVLGPQDDPPPKAAAPYSPLQKGPNYDPSKPLSAPTVPPRVGPAAAPSIYAGRWSDGGYTAAEEPSHKPVVAGTPSARVPEYKEPTPLDRAFGREAKTGTPVSSARPVTRAPDVGGGPETASAVSRLDQAFGRATVAATKNAVATETQNKGILASIKAKIKEIDATMQARSGLSVVGKEATSTAAALGRLAGAGATAGVSMAGTGVGLLGRGVGKGLMGLMGAVGGPAGIALMGGMYGGMAIKGSMDKAEELKKENAEGLRQANDGLRVYSDKLGIASRSLVTFADSLNKAARPNTVEAAMTSQEVSAAARANPEYTNPGVRFMMPEQAVTWTLQQGQLTPDQAAEISMDWERRFGKTKADAMRRQYLEQTNKGTEPVSGRPGGPAEPDWSAAGSGIRQLNDEKEKDTRWGTANGPLPRKYEVEGVGWASTRVGWGGIADPDQNQTWESIKSRPESPVRQIADTQLQQYDTQMDWVARKQTTGDTEADELVVANAGVKAAIGLSSANFDGYDKLTGSGQILKAALAEQNLQATLQRMGMDEQTIQDTLNKFNLRKEAPRIAEMSEEERKQYLWDEAYSQTTQGQALTSRGKDWRDAETAAVMAPDQDVVASSREAAKAMSKISPGLEKFAEAWSDDKAIQTAVNDKLSSDPLANAKAIDRLVGAAENTSKNTYDQVNYLRVLGEKSTSNKVLADQAIQRIQGEQERKLIGVNQETLIGFGNQRINSAIENLDPRSESSINELRESKSEQETLIRTMHTKWRDYWRQRKWDESDYYRSVKRMQYDYQLQIKYSTEDFQRQQKWSKADFNRSMRREEKEHSIQMRLFKESMAIGTNPTSRIYAQPTMSAKTAATNIGEHIRRLQQAKRDLAKLRKMGLSTDAIDIMQLADPAQQQELHRLAMTASAEDIQELSSKSAKYKKEFADSYMTDPKYNKGLRDQEENRKRGIKHQVDDFERGARRSGKMFEQAMQRSADAQKRQLRIMNDDRQRSLRRSERQMIGWAKDIVKPIGQVAKELDGFLDKVGVKGANAVKKRVDAAIESINKAREALKTLEELAARQERVAKPKKPPKMLDRDKDNVSDYVDIDGGDGTGKPRKGVKRYKKPPENPHASGNTHDSRETGGTNRDTGIHRRDPNVYDRHPSRGRPRYAMGGVTTGPVTYGLVGEAGNEAIVPLNSHGVEFLVSAFERYARRHKDPFSGLDSGQHTKGKNMSFGEASQAMQIYNNQTYFNGGITVVSQDPDDMARKLKHMKRLANLRNPRTVR